MLDQRVTGFELSLLQERLYTLSKGQSVFQCRTAVLIEGTLDVARLRSAIETAISSYEILRTNFRLLPGRRRLLQVVQANPAGALEIIDMRAWRSDNEAQRVHRYLEDLGAASMDLDGGALARVQLLTLGENRSLLVLAASSLCADSSTLTIVLNEILRRYEGDGAAPAESLQYADFASWQRDLMESDEDEAKQGREFWSRQEMSAQALRTLPYERLQPDAEFAPRAISAPLGDDLARELAARWEADAEPAKDFLLASWVALVFRLTHQEEGVVGRVVDGRAYEELRSSPGLFSKALPISWRIDGNTPFEAFVDQIAAATAEAEPWQDFAPLGDTPDASRFSDLSFTWEPRFSRRSVAGAEVSLVEQFAVTDHFGLNLVCGLADGKVTAEIRYDAGRFASADIVRLAEQFALLTRGAAASASAPIGDLPILSEQELHRVTKEWNATEAPYPQDAFIHTLFERQAERVPEAPALVSGGVALTFAQLNARANQIAHTLRAQGVAPNVPVALCVERSADMIVGLLAIMKSGGFYAPLAADLPPARLHDLLGQTRAALVLTQSPLKDRFQGWDGPILSLDTDAGQWASAPEGNLAPVNTADDLAYVIFTSGSTGAPKGVGNRHRALVNYTAFIAGKLGLTDTGDYVQQHFGVVSTLNADLGNTSVLTSLAYGGCLHVIDYETTVDGERFAQYVQEHPIDVLKITPSHLRALLASSESAILPRNTLFLGGEALTWDLLDQVRRRGSCKVFNHYGPTETTIGSLTYDASGSHGPDDSATAPIGRPIANTRIYILDERRNPVPVGAPGELFIGGAGLAQGYLHQPEQTAERFVLDPFVGDGETRMYRTGDRARYLSDGNVEFLGRIDDQVKIRGFRVEPGEVESVLRRHPQVRSAAVVVTEDQQGASRLVGYYVSDSSIAAEQVREHLTDYLPDYMIPASLIPIAELPLTPNGKLDRKALLDQETVAQAAAFVGPRNATEEKLTEIWVQILKHEPIGVHDDFFELGGHSLLMTQILARIRSAFQVQLALHMLFDKPTIAGLAGVIDGAQSAESEDDEMQRLLAELEGLTDDEVNRLLSEESK
ncbi:hypothetical protein CCAX7_24910 [Capsulimonas corticalis]|uniref:Uncharacterized protein n=1 Tax=Capsulimonas corticalis TaxID=2219043 RepID=A0A402CVK8_9BACT|nr:non-ribosomal peptide synthetase [Capsulimonas corticalis]BDI30440.1 hypothetical protein CCAX7_24910 [Capsulimonas corticalis]